MRDCARVDRGEKRSFFPREKALRIPFPAFLFGPSHVCSVSHLRPKAGGEWMSFRSLDFAARAPSKKSATSGVNAQMRRLHARICVSTGRVRDGGTARALWGARARAPWRLWESVIDAGAVMAAVFLAAASADGFTARRDLVSARGGHLAPSIASH